MGLIDLAHRLFRSSQVSTPADTRIYVIGDIHGRCDLLKEMQEKINDDIYNSENISKIIKVFLGDYIDRGEQSRQVIDFFLQDRQQETESIYLKGNHEATLLKFLCDPGILSSWQNFGGLETLHSYGVRLAGMKESGGFETIRQQFLDLLPREHFDFYHSLQKSVSLGDYFFCHAGVKPGVSLEKQREEDLIWIREEFLESNADYGKVIVHGHTPVNQPEIWKNRINIDTGAYLSNKLTCLVLEGDSKKCL